MKNCLFLVLSLLLCSTLSFGQIFNPVKWDVQVRHIDADEYVLTYSASIDKGWAVYSQYLESDEGPVATSILYENPEVVEFVGDAEESGHRKEGHDEIFDMNVIKFVDEYHITQKINAKAGQTLKGYLTYMTCDDKRCLPPTDVEFAFDLISMQSKPDQEGSSKGAKDGAGASDDLKDHPPKKEGNTDGEVRGHDEKSTDEKVGEKGGSFSAELNTQPGMGETPSSSFSEPVIWTAAYLPGDLDRVVFTAEIEEGWYIYDQQIEGDDGPIPTEFTIGHEIKLLPYEAENEIEEKDEFFGGMLIKKIKTRAKYTYEVTSDGVIDVEIAYMTCDEGQCIFPMHLPNFTIDPSARTVTAISNTEETGILELGQGEYPVPPIDIDNPVGACGESHHTTVAKKGLLSIFFIGILGGLLALITPCVFPMIPLTVSFFTKGSEDKRKGMRKAVLYGFFILLVYLLLSIPFHLLDSVNPGILNDISTNVFLNIFFFAIFVFFAFSFFGFYELTIPSKWTNKVSNAESVGGVVGIFFMALTLALVSFSCTGPILGTLLAGALTSEGGAMQLTAGMGGFGLALALPFALFAAFPSMLSSLPKSGGWLNTVKVTLGFLELALAFKFLSNADLVKRWGLLKIEPFLAIWMVIFIGLAIYLFGKWKFPHDSPVKKLSFLRISTGILSLAFAIYLATGFRVDSSKNTFKSLTLLSGLAPPAGYSWLYPNKCPNNLDCFKDLEKGMAYAKEMDKPVMIDFTGHACVNCRKMEEHVWPQKGVSEKLEKDFVLISLYVDEKIEIPEEEQDGKWRTYGQKWQAFQASYFNNNSQPYYVLLSPDGQLLNNPVGYTPDPEEYAAFLECGLNAFQTLTGDGQIGSIQGLE